MFINISQVNLCTQLYWHTCKNTYNLLFPTFHHFFSLLTSSLASFSISPFSRRWWRNRIRHPWHVMGRKAQIGLSHIVSQRIVMMLIKVWNVVSPKFLCFLLWSCLPQSQVGFPCSLLCSILCACLTQYLYCPPLCVYSWKALYCLWRCFSSPGDSTFSGRQRFQTGMHVCVCMCVCVYMSKWASERARERERERQRDGDRDRDRDRDTESMYHIFFGPTQPLPCLLICMISLAACLYVFLFICLSTSHVRTDDNWNSFRWNWKSISNS